MRRTVLEQARNLMKRRRFGMAARLLESYAANYRGSFEYYLALGTSFLYLDDEGNAARYYQAARDIHVNSSELLLGQAALFLRHGNNAKAIHYYLDVLEMDPNNRVAKDAMEFIRTKGKDYMVVQRLKSNGKIRKFYPQVGTNPDFIRNCVLGGIVFVLAVVFTIVVWPKETVKWNGKRMDLSSIALTESDKRHSTSDSVSQKAVHYLLDKDTVVKCYENAVMYFQDERDNPARVEINRILNSNASSEVKTKASLLLENLKEITFDKLPDGDNYPYAKIEEDHILYNGCYVAWKGTIANAKENDNGDWQCQLLVGYEDGKHVDGNVDVVFHAENRVPINPERPIMILGVVTERAGKLLLDGRAVHQPVNGKFN